MADELTAYNADICGLQETFKWHEYFANWFDSRGYGGRFVEKRGGADGCALTWRKSRFELLSYDEFEYEQAMREEGLDGDVKPNVGQVAILRDRVTSAVMAVANTHLYWKRDCERVRLKQIHYLRSRIRDPTMPLILLGGTHACLHILLDFNCSPQSIVYRWNTPAHGGVEEELASSNFIERIGCIDASIADDFLNQWPALHSAYANYCPDSSPGEPPLTTFVADFKGVLDYILLSQHFFPIELLAIPDERVLGAQISLPNEIFASDHVALMARILCRSTTGTATAIRPSTTQQTANASYGQL